MIFKLTILYFSSAIIHYFDPLFSFISDEIINVIKFIFEWNYRKVNRADSNIKFEVKHMEVPDQSRGDCGIFMVAFFRMMLMDGKIGYFSSQDAELLRRDTAELLRTQVINDGVELPDLQFD